MRIKNKPYKMTVQIILLLITIGLAAGILSGLVGVGGGIIVVPALVFFLSFSQQQAQGTSLGLLLLPVGILAVINYYNKGQIDIRVVGIMAAAFVIGGWLGSKWALSLPEITVKRIFAVILFYSGINMLVLDEMIYRAIKNIFG
jgi:uncharacterized membrane protein YfcA